MSQTERPATTVTKDYIVSCINAGQTDAQIASALSVSQSAIAQLVDKYGLRESAQINETFSEIDALYNKTELSAIKHLSRTVGLISDPMKLSRIIQVVNGAKRRSLAMQGKAGEDGTSKIINLRLPKHVEVQVQLNARNQVAEIDGREIATLPSGNLLAEVSQDGKNDS